MHFTNIIQHTNSSIVFDIAEVDVSIVNAIRRTILTNVPSVGFYFKLKDHFVENDINIEKNESPLHNEFLSHRFSLIPVHFSKDEIDEWDSKMYTFVIDKTNKTSDLMNITTQDFEILDKDGTVLPKKFRDRIFPADIITKDHILITKFPTNLDNIEKGHQLKLNAFAQKGIAKDCICWSMVSQSSYFNTLDEKAINSFLKEMKKNK
jgi:DNA-directed RNA polymerase alpha subunit